jgi:rubrerythrin
MHQMTESNLAAAFAGESQAHMKYMIFADQAEREGFANVARLFRAISFAEQAHATGHFRTMGNVGKTTENLGAAIAGETYEVTEMYPAFDAVAKLQEEKSAIRSIMAAWEAEKIHAGMYANAKSAVDGGADAQIGQIHVCSICGHTGFGEAPDQCPVCRAKKEKFSTF